MSVYIPEISLQPEKLSGQALLDTLYTASDCFELLKAGLFRKDQPNVVAEGMRKNLCEELSMLFDELRPGVYNLSGYPSDISYCDAIGGVTDVPHTITLGEPIKLELSEFLGIRENRHGKLSVEIAYPMAGFMAEIGQAAPRVYVIPLEAVTEITEVAYFIDTVDTRLSLEIV